MRRLLVGVPEMPTAMVLNDLPRTAGGALAFTPTSTPQLEAASVGDESLGTTPIMQRAVELFQLGCDAQRADPVMGAGGVPHVGDVSVSAAPSEAHP